MSVYIALLHFITLLLILRVRVIYRKNTHTCFLYIKSQFQKQVILVKPLCLLAFLR